MRVCGEGFFRGESESIGKDLRRVMEILMKKIKVIIESNYKPVERKKALWSNKRYYTEISYSIF